jgi:acetyl-CoA acetyltransferase
MTRLGIAKAAPRVFEMAGVTHADIDVAEIYDCFTYIVLCQLEDLGFCAKGEGGAFVASGAISPGGSLPVNTNGGGLSCCHPGMYGMFAMVEAVRQMRGTAANQIAGAKTALAHGNGGTLSAQATVIFGNAETV